MQIRKHLSTSAALLAALTMGAAALPAAAVGTDHAQADKGSLMLAAADTEHHSDTWITTKVKAKLLEENFKAGVDIKVTTQDGVVQLAGHVKKPEQISQAENIASNIDGVKRVQNDLTVK